MSISRLMTSSFSQFFSTFSDSMQQACQVFYSIIWSLFTKKYMCLALNFFSLWLTYWWGCDSHKPFFKLFQWLFSISKILSRVSSLSFLLIFFIHQHININFTISHFLGFTSHLYFYSVSFQSSFFKKKMVCVLKLLKSDFSTRHCSETDYTKISNNLLLGLLQWRLQSFSWPLQHWMFVDVLFLFSVTFFISTFTLTFLANYSLFHSSHPQWA